MDGLLKEIRERRARRAFSEKKIPEDVVQMVLTSATYAPSCQNNQPWRFLVATDDESLQKIHDALPGPNYWVKKAPVVVVVATKMDLTCQLDDNRDYAFLDCGLAVENLLLQATKEGLFAHPIAGFNPIKVKENFNIPMDYRVITLIPIAYPGDDSHLNEKHLGLEHSSRDRKPESEVICYDKWGF